MRYYVGLLHKDADSDYGVSFPDFPGCITAGDADGFPHSRGAGGDALPSLMSTRQSGLSGA
jgi:hypothetical protein